MQLVPDRSGSSLLLVAPPQPEVTRFQNAVIDEDFHDDLLSKVQRLRGRIYLEDGAIRERDLTGDGRHADPLDKVCWHLVGVDQHGDPISCVRYRQHENTVKYSRLGVSSTPIARSLRWSYPTRKAIERDLVLARQLGVPYVELGGWAIAPKARCTSEVLRMVLGTYAVWRFLGGALGIGTLTQRHSSCSIVRRFGGQALSIDGVTLPKYQDERYGCEMEILRFSSEDVNPRFADGVDEMQQYLERIPVVQPRISEVPAAAHANRERRYWENQLVCAH